MNFFDFIAWISRRVDDAERFFGEVYSGILELEAKYASWRAKRAWRHLVRLGERADRYYAEHPGERELVEKWNRELDAAGESDER